MAENEYEDIKTKSEKKENAKNVVLILTAAANTKEVLYANVLRINYVFNECEKCYPLCHFICSLFLSFSFEMEC